MTRKEAEQIVRDYNKDPRLSGRVVRILPEHIDPIKPGDNGWDVSVTHFPDFNIYED